ncbi:hypothetical protein TWF506_009584 [Arthrobotrys conoides]|uniref:Uncharacterized protein n=1 Tax=Arthrobotrys conoides TaxID=74498 RepID=A0AAN8RLD7_9PEZI
MSLHNGRYYIYIHPGADRPARSVFRSRSEDLSLLPKRIFALPAGVTGETWELANSSGGSINLTANEALTGVTPQSPDDGPYAFLLVELAHTIGWKIEKVEGADNRRYIITTKDGELAWTLTDHEDYARGIVIGLEPKNGSPRQVFTFVESKGYAYDDEDYFLSGASRKPAYNKEKEYVPQSRFGYKRNGRGRNFCD